MLALSLSLSFSPSPLKKKPGSVHEWRAPIKHTSMCLHFLLVHLLKITATRSHNAKQTCFDMFHSQAAIHIPSMYKQSDSSLCRVWQVSSGDGARIPGVKAGVLQLTSMGQNPLHTRTHREKESFKSTHTSFQSII